MKAIIKTKDEIEKIAEASKVLSAVLDEVLSSVEPGVATSELDKLAFRLIEKYGGEPAFLNYKPAGHKIPYPASICVSINDEIIHGIPSPDKIIKDGDVVSIDCGIKMNGVFSDHAKTVAVGDVSDDVLSMIKVCEGALYAGINEAIAGNKSWKIGRAVEKYINGRFGIVREFCGHGVGRYIHEPPNVFNYTEKRGAVTLEPGMIIAIEPMITMGKLKNVTILDDGYTVVPNPRSLSCHFEHTVLITDSGPEILTKN